MIVTHPGNVIICARRRTSDRLDIKSYEHGFHTGLFELVNHRFFSLGCPGAVPILGKRFYIGSLRLDPGLRVGVAMQIDDSHNSHLADEEARCQFDDPWGVLNPNPTLFLSSSGDEPCSPGQWDTTSRATPHPRE